MRKLILTAVASTAFALAGQHHPRKCKTCRNFMDLCLLYTSPSPRDA